MEQNKYFTSIPLIHHAVVGVLSSEIKQEHRQGALEETGGNKISLLHRRHDDRCKVPENLYHSVRTNILIHQGYIRINIQNHGVLDQK